MSLQLYKSAVEDRVGKIIKDHNNEDNHTAFLRLIFYLVTGLGYDDLEPEDIIDGQGDYQIDVLHIDTSSSENLAIVTLIQATFSDSLSSTKLVKLHAGLDYLLQRPKTDYSNLSNTMLREKIQDFRDLRADILPSKIRLQCYYACLGDPSKQPAEFADQVKRIKSDYSSAGDFAFEVLGPNEIFELIGSREHKGIKVHEKLSIIYDQNKANLLEHSIEGVSGVICTITANEVARIVNKHPTVFDENLRRFLGLTGAVNQAIKESCVSPNDAHLFWFLNNGITIVCDNFVIHKDYDNPFIDIENLRIVNGCQTSTTLAKTQEDSQLQPSIKVMLRIFMTRSPDLASRLVVTTNNQNKITSRDLRSQDKIQEHIKDGFYNRFKLHYERSSNEFSDRTKYPLNLVISNQKIGQSYLSIVLKRPSDGSRRQYKVWSEDYQSIFNENVYPETYLIVYGIAEACLLFKRTKLRNLPDKDIRRVIVNNGVYHISRIASFIWRQGDNWNDLLRLRQDLQKIKDAPDLLNKYFEEGLSLMVKMCEEDEQFTQDPSVTLKSARLDDLIDKELYLKMAKTAKNISRRPRRK